MFTGLESPTHLIIVLVIVLLCCSSEESVSPSLPKA